MKLTTAVFSSIALVGLPRYFVGAFTVTSKLPARSKVSTLNKFRHLLFRSVSTTSTAHPMIFEKFFSSLGGGGGFSAKIDYSTLPYPCTDLAIAAVEGKSLEEIERNGKSLNVATFAGGCFWGLELAYQRVPGVEYTAVGYQQGPELQPNYDQVCAGATGHTETVCVFYDRKVCPYETLLDTFFERVNPFTINGQGNDFGKQYRTGVYYHSEEQEQAARNRFAKEQAQYGTKERIATECLNAMPFWPAEKYHQQYLENGKSSQSAEKGCKDTIRCYG